MLYPYYLYLENIIFQAGKKNEFFTSLCDHRKIIFFRNLPKENIKVLPAWDHLWHRSVNGTVFVSAEVSWLFLLRRAAWETRRLFFSLSCDVKLQFPCFGVNTI